MKSLWFLYVIKQSTLFSDEKELVVYQSSNPDVFHTIGEIYSRSIEPIFRVDYARDNDGIWINQTSLGSKVRIWRDKYPNIPICKEVK